MEEFASRQGLDSAAPLSAFRRRVQFAADRGLDLEEIGFPGGLGLADYYTGFVFEMHDPTRPGGDPVAGGGRYDRLPASGRGGRGAGGGFALWLDRLAGEETP